MHYQESIHLDYNAQQTKAILPHAFSKQKKAITKIFSVAVWLAKKIIVWVAD